jgi:uncharacterized protein (DUF952 family)
MVKELVFHIVSRRKWRDWTANGKYSPEILAEVGFITCAKGDSVGKIADRKYQGRKNLYLLVIDPVRIESKVTVEKDKNSDDEIIAIHGPVNLDAIIDKILLQPDEDGFFNIRISS